MNELIKAVIEHHKELKAKEEKWLSENEDIKGSAAYQFALLHIALADFSIALWSTFLNTQGAG